MLGWIRIGQSFLANKQRLVVTILQVSVIGIIAIAAAAVGGTSLAGGVGRITGTVIGVIILGVTTSGFTVLRIDAYCQEIVKGAIIVTAVVLDPYRQKKRSKARWNP